MQKPAIVFGMNSMFAVRHFLPEILTMAGERGFCVTVIAPPGDDNHTGRNACATEPIPGVEVRHVAMEREIAPLSDLLALWRMWAIFRSVRPAVTNVSTPKMGLIGGLAAWLARVPHRVYTLRGLRYET